MTETAKEHDYKKENEELLSANINMHDALDLKSERIQELKKRLAVAVEALKRITEIPDQEEYFDCEECISMMEEAAEQALAEIGGEDE